MNIEDRAAKDSVKETPETEDTDSKENEHLFDANLNCKHEIEILWSGIKCKKCKGWYCA